MISKSALGRAQVTAARPTISKAVMTRSDHESRRGLLGARTLAAVAMSLALSSGCGPAADEGPVSFAQIRPLLKPSCALSSSCHASSASISGNLSLSEADAYCALVGASQGQTTRSTAKAQFPSRVVAGNVDASFLYKKLTIRAPEAGVSTAQGQAMPPGQPWTDADLSLVRRWIAGGAQNDSGTAAPGGCN